MILRPDRSRRGPDNTLLARMGMLAVGGVLALAGMLWDRAVLVWIAIAVLAAGLLLRVIESRRSADSPDNDE